MNILLIKKQKLPLSKLEENRGQLEGLPENPRYITDEKFQLLKANIEKHVDLLEYRCLLVYPLSNGNYIVIGGNQRLLAMRDLNFEDAWCIILDDKTPIERLKALTILDNASFGKWDMDSLANLWEESKLESFGVDIPKFDSEELEGLFQQQPKADSNEPATEKIIITIPEEWEDDKNSVLELVDNLLSDLYPGCSVSFQKL